jgi:hypothetical protein
VRFLEELKLANTDGDNISMDSDKSAKWFPNVESSPLILLIEQFEEVCSLCKKDTERHIFIEKSYWEAATTPEAKTLVIATLRSGVSWENPTAPATKSNHGFRTKCNYSSNMTTQRS